MSLMASPKSAPGETTIGVTAWLELRATCATGGTNVNVALEGEGGSYAVVVLPAVLTGQSTGATVVTGAPERCSFSVCRN